MPRRARLRLAGIPWHIVQRGHDQKRCFFEAEDYTSYLNHAVELSREHECAIHAYVLMTNHVHLLLTPPTEQAASRFMKALAQRATQRINRLQARSGSLWEGRFRSSLIEASRYLMTCYRYIELNPVRAGLVTVPRAYPWSSYRTNAEGEYSPLITPHAEYLALGDGSDRLTAYCELFGTTIAPTEFALIRERTHGGFALASAEYCREIGGASGWPAQPKRQLRYRRPART